jgi:uncharacterized oxidoreductase
MSRLLDRPTKLLVTGGTSGVGTALTWQLLAAGHQVVVLARRAGAMAPQPGLHAVPCDLSDVLAVQKAAALIASAHPDLRILIHNAAVQHALPLSDSSPEHLIEEATVNLLAPALLTQALAPSLSKGGAVVNVTSGLAFFPKERGGLYAATKAGLHSFTQSLRYQMERQGVAVVEVVLPLVDTPMTAGRGRGKINAEAAATAILRGLAQGRPVIRVGAARALPVIAALAPWLGRRMLRGS